MYGDTSILQIYYSISIAGSLNDLTQPQKDFVTRYIQSINSKNENQLKELMHSSFVNCLNESNKDYFSDLFQRTLKYAIPDHYEVSIETLTDDAVVKEMEGAKQLGLPYPVQPTHQLQIDFNKSKYSSVTIVRKLVQEGNQFYEVSGCPTKEMIEKFREVRIKKDEELLRSRKLFEGLKDPLLSELTKLLKEGRKIEAWKKYSEATGESLATAKEVLSYTGIEQ